MLPLLIEVLVACCDCYDPVYFNYTNCSMSISNLDNTGAEPVVTEPNTISKDAYGIRVEIYRNEDICKVKPNPSLVFQSAYAMSCDCPPEFEYTALDSITDIKITSLNDFDSEHLANADVTEYFYVSSGREFTEVSKFVENMHSTLYYSFDPGFEFDLLLMLPPTLGPEHQFSIEVELSDGRILNAQTEVLELN